MSGDKLSMASALKVASLDKDAQAEIADRIQRGVDPQKVIADYIAKPTAKHKETRNAWNSRSRSLFVVEPWMIGAPSNSAATASS